MPEHATVLNLVQSIDTDEAELCSRLGVQRLTIVPGAEVRDKGAIGGLAHISATHSHARSDTFAIHCNDWSRQPRRHIAYLLACMASPGKRVALDRKWRSIPLTWQGLLFGEMPRAIGDYLGGARLLSKSRAFTEAQLKKGPTRRTVVRGGVRSVGYLRTDLWYDVKAGGSVGHVAGVVNGFGKNGVRAHVLSWEEPAMIEPMARFSAVEPTEFATSEREFALLAYNDRLVDQGLALLNESRPDAVYARYSLDCWAPVILADRLNVPLIVEYNGSEIWIEQNWGRGLLYPDIALKVEIYLLENADLITVVSRALKDELVGRGFEEKRILVNPNSVDPSIFNPERFHEYEIQRLKKELGILEGSTVAGFIGTFSPWHGVEILAEAIPMALRDCSRLHFLLIGAGPLLDEVRERLRVADALDNTTFTGLVPQDQAAKYLMCADFFLSPHVPNPDGTPFFGSPTKLFEYMALGKGIVASNLDQIGEILVDGETGLLVPPGDAEKLSDAITRLYENPDLGKRLGEAARAEALAKHTWKAHVGRILEALYSL
jgi:glycosyltransferase involved in cell wall biosynthesis